MQRKVNFCSTPRELDYTNFLHFLHVVGCTICVLWVSPRTDHTHSLKLVQRYQTLSLQVSFPPKASGAHIVLSSRFRNAPPMWKLGSFHNTATQPLEVRGFGKIKI